VGCAPVAAQALEQDGVWTVTLDATTVTIDGDAAIAVQ
jgi:hypothetical protein